MAFLLFWVSASDLLFCLTSILVMVLLLYCCSVEGVSIGFVHSGLGQTRKFVAQYYSATVLQLSKGGCVSVWKRVEYPKIRTFLDVLNG